MDDKRILGMIVAGVGFWGQSWVHVVGESPHWDLVGLVDLDESALERSAAAIGLDRSRCFSSIAAAAQATPCDAALIAVPPGAHAGLAHEALSGGLHCLIEKPFATTLEEALEVTRHAASARRVAMVSQQYRHRRGARTVARIVESAPLGKIGAAHVTFANELASFGYHRDLGEPLLWDVAIHHFDLLRGILEIEPCRVQATSWNPSWSALEGNVSATAVLETADGVAVTYTGSLAPRGPKTGWDGLWTIACERGVIEWDGDKVVVRPLARPLRARVMRRAFNREWHGHRVRPVHVHEPDRLGSLADFARAIREGTEPETSARDNLRSLALTVATIESARRREAVDVLQLD